MDEAELKKLKAAFNRKKIHTEKKGILWKLTFDQWLQAWLDSGKFKLRGKGKDAYYMTIKDRTKPYELGNLDFQKGSQVSNGRGPDTPRDQGLTSSDQLSFMGTVHTPNGIFSSVVEAAQALSLSQGTLRRRLDSSNYEDYWFEDKDGTIFSKSKRNTYPAQKESGKVKTPKGIFDNAKLAAKAHGCTPATMGRWIKLKGNDFYRINE